MSRRRIWVTIGDGVVAVTKGGRDGFPSRKPQGFLLPEARTGEAADGSAPTDISMNNADGLATFIADCISRYAKSNSISRSDTKKLSVLLGAGLSFYEEYIVNIENKSLCKEQRALALSHALGSGDDSKYIVEDIRRVPAKEKIHAKEDALAIRAVCGVERDFLAGLAKALRKRGHRVEFASSAQAALRMQKRSVRGFPDFTWGGRESRRFGKVTTVLCVCAVAAALAIAAIQPIQAWQAESEAKERRTALTGEADAAYYEMLKEHRQVQARLPYYRDLTAMLDDENTAYGDLLQSLRTGILQNAAIEELALSEDGSLLVSFTTKDIATVESELEALNESRRMSAAEIGQRKSIGKKKNRAWKVQIKISYFTFGDDSMAAGAGEPSR